MELIKINTRCNCSAAWVEATDVEIAPGEYIVVKTNQGPKMAKVVCAKRKTESEKFVTEFKLIRKATEEDLEKYEELREREKEAFNVCLEKITEHKLVMKLVRVEFLIDESKAIFYFTAADRVDFRELVKDLAHNFHTRIEMRQIGVRDEAKMTGGVGNCGREFCCTSFLSSFEPVSVRMAKEQNLALNPMKISGACGRLMCCLAYEHSTYIRLKKGFPKCGKKVETPFGAGKVIRQEILNNRVLVILETGEEKTISVEDIQVIKKERT